jgi:hypothetical protein
VIHNFDRGAKKFKKIFYVLYGIMAQERHPLSQAFKLEIYFEMKKIIDGCYRLFCSLLFMLVLACLHVYLAFSQTVPTTAGVKYLVWNRITLMLGTLRFSCQAV